MKMLNNFTHKITTKTFELKLTLTTPDEFIDIHRLKEELPEYADTFIENIALVLLEEKITAQSKNEN